MTWNKSFLRFITLGCAFLLALFPIAGVPVRVMARSPQFIISQELPSRFPNYEPPPNIGKPGRREGGGTRSPCLMGATRPTALVPDQPMAFGTTVGMYPTFFVYLPPIEPSMKARLAFDLKEENQQEIYQTVFRVTQNGGILSLSLPANANLPPLEVDKNYQWSFQLTCADRDSSFADGGVVASLNGSIARVQLSSTLERQLRQATDRRDRAALYARNGVWYDALNTLAELRRARPDDENLAADWAALLDSVGIKKDVIPPELLVRTN